MVKKNYKMMQKAFAFICIAAAAASLGGCSIKIPQNVLQTPSAPSAVSSEANTPGKAHIDSDLVTVPNVEKLRLENATAALEAAQLSYTIKENVSSEPENTVIMQSPAANEKVEKGTSILIIVAKPEATAQTSSQTENDDVSSDNSIEAKYFVGFSFDDAKAYYEGHGVNIEYDKEFSRTYAFNIVTYQEGSPGGRVKPGDTIHMTVSLGAQGINLPAPDWGDAFAVFSRIKSSSNLNENSGYSYNVENVLDDAEGSHKGMCWCEGKTASGDVGIGEWIWFTNDEKVAVNGLTIINGYNIDFDRFRKNGRVTELRIETDDPKKSFTWHNIDTGTMGQQSFYFGETVYTRNLKITISGAIPGTECSDTCISLVIPRPPV